MTEQHDSEVELFEESGPSPESVSPTRSRTHGKRPSLGPRLPVRMSMPEGSRRSKSEDDMTMLTSATTRVRSGTKMDGIMMSVTSEDGSTEVINVWSDVVRGTNAKHLHTFVTAISKDKGVDVDRFIMGIMYQGFNREFYIKHALSTLPISVFIRFALLGAIRGSNFNKVKDSCDDMPDDLVTIYNSGRIVKTPKKRTDLTILRFTASVPQWCAYWMHSAGVEKKIATEDCPAFLQFPGAASLPMSSDLRRQHIRFSVAFSKLLPSGKFSESIYLTAYSNLIPMNELPDSLKLQLGVSSLSDAKTLTAADVQQIVKDYSK